MDYNKDIYDIWIQQQNYNAEIRQRQDRTSSEWLINYILGTVSELGELLDQTNWKTHRLSSSVGFGPNIEEELADITKYVFSMWQLLEYTPSDMCRIMYRKGIILDQLLKQETREPMKDRTIIMLDLDGCIADFRKGFFNWLPSSKWKDKLKEGDKNVGLHLDLNNGWDFATYNEAKLEFEIQGGYSTLPLIHQVSKLTNALYNFGWYIIVYTARPFSTYKRIWADTWNWLQANEVNIHELNFGYESRIETAQKLSVDNKVIAIEDDPILINRYTSSGIDTIMVPQPYNKSIPQLSLMGILDGSWTPVELINFMSYREG